MGGGGGRGWENWCIYTCIAGLVYVDLPGTMVNIDKTHAVRTWPAAFKRSIHWKAILTWTSRRKKISSMVSGINDDSRFYDDSIMNL